MDNTNELISKVLQQPGLSSKVYRDEPILRTAAQMKNDLPEKCRRMRRLAFQGGSRSLTSAEIFYKQGKFMEDYEDDCPYSGTFFRYFPTYESMSDSQLRGYFTWRTRVRTGDIQKTELSFVYVYLYELLNGIGALDPPDGYHKLQAFYEAYRKIDMQINRYVELWLRDYVVYYNLDPALLSGSNEAEFDRALSVLVEYETASDDALFDAVCALSSYKVERSRFYREQPQALREVLCETYRNLSRYYTKHRKYSLTEAYFGKRFTTPYTMFYSAIFYPRTPQQDRTYAAGALTCFTCRNGRWTCTRLWGQKGPNTELGALVRAVDGIMRTELAYPYPLKNGSVPKYLEKIIRDSMDSCRRVRKEKAIRDITIDLSKLQNIRDAAEITRDRLIVDEEPEEPQMLSEPAQAEEKVPENTPPEKPLAEKNDPFSLTATERAVLECLLRHESPEGVLRGSGVMLSVAADAINEKCFDTFADTVLVYDGDTLCVLDDYAQELRGMLT